MNFVSAANNQNIKTKVYDEGVIISGYLPDAAVGDGVLITVLNRNIDIDTFDKYEELEDIIVYQDETKIDEKNEYEFLLKTKSGGKHYAYVASGAYSEIMTGEYSYISKTVYDNIPKNSKIDLYEYMKSNRNLMGIDEDYYTDDVIAYLDYGGGIFKSGRLC